MQEQDFYNYSLYIKDERDYHRNWVFAVFKSYYGKWNTKKLKEQGKPIKPTQEYLDWLYTYQERWVSSKKWYKRVRDTIFRGGISFLFTKIKSNTNFYLYKSNTKALVHHNRLIFSIKHNNKIVWVLMFYLISIYYMYILIPTTLLSILILPLMGMWC